METPNLKIVAVGVLYTKSDGWHMVIETPNPREAAYSYGDAKPFHST